MRALEIITGYVIYNPAYTYKFQLKTTYARYAMKLGLDVLHQGPVAIGCMKSYRCQLASATATPFRQRKVIVSLHIQFLVG